MGVFSHPAFAGFGDAAAGQAGPKKLEQESNEPRGEHAIVGKKTTPKGITELRDIVRASLEDDKAEDIVVIDLAGKTSIADYMFVASGRSQRQVGAITEHLVERLKAAGFGPPIAEGLAQCDWVLVDAGDVIVHVFRPEVRAFYNLEKMWGAIGPDSGETEIGRAGRRRA